jgi:hypothetical protein
MDPQPLAGRVHRSGELPKLAAGARVASSSNQTAKPSPSSAVASGRATASLSSLACEMKRS